MRARAKTRQPSSRRRAAVAVQVGVMMTTLVGVAALTIDVGALYNTKADLQRTADAAALAAASELADFSTGDSKGLAKQAAVDYAYANAVMGKPMILDTDSDIVFGRAVYDKESNAYIFTPTNTLPDAVKVSVRHTADSPNGAVPLYFASLFGKSKTNMAAEAIAMMIPRDIAIVADLSGSHNDDTEIPGPNGTVAPVFEVWDNLPGGIDDYTGDLPTYDAIGGSWTDEDGALWSFPPEWIEDGSYIPQAAGPAFGYFKQIGYGEETVLRGSYDPVSDPGLVYLPRYSNWNNADLEAALYARGYITSEVEAIMSDDYDSDGAWEERVAAALGFAHWNSGHGHDPDTDEPARWEKEGLPAGNGNNWVGSSELTWVETFNNRNIAQSKSFFESYITYMRNTTKLKRYDSDFRYRFGMKTFVNFLQESRYMHSQTPELADTPEQPMQAVKDAVGVIVSELTDLDTDDQMSLEIYGQTARHEVNLTHDHSLVQDRLNDMQAGHYDSWTNMGGGLEEAIEELTSARARSGSHKMIILLTDGMANVSANGSAGNTSGGEAYARAQAQVAADLGFRIFAVSVGENINADLMDDIAEMGGGEHLRASGSIEEYSDELAEIFRRLGGERPVELIR